MVVLWFCFLLFLLLTIMFFRGKGSFLISGYNTADQREKDQYDEKKLLRVMGYCMGVCCLGILFMIIFLKQNSRLVTGIFIAIVLVDIIITMILTNTVCRKPSVKAGAGEAGSKNDNDGGKFGRKISWIVCGFVILVSVVIIFILTTGNVDVRLGEDQLNITCSYWPDRSIDYNRIENVSYSENWNPGNRVSGFGSFRLNLGRFENSQKGRYDLYAYTDCSSFIMIETDEGVVVVNNKDEASTKDLYEKIHKKFTDTGN